MNHRHAGGDIAEPLEGLSEPLMMTSQPADRALQPYGRSEPHRGDRNAGLVFAPARPTATWWMPWVAASMSGIPTMRPVDERDRRHLSWVHGPIAVSMLSNVGRSSGDE